MKKSLLLLKIISVLANFLILWDPLLFKCFSLWGEKLMEVWFYQWIQQHDVIMTSNYVIVWIKLCLNVGSNEFITLCNIEVIEGELLRSKEAKKACLNRVKLVKCHCIAYCKTESAIDRVTSLSWVRVEFELSLIELTLSYQKKCLFSTEFFVLYN